MQMPAMDLTSPRNFLNHLEGVVGVARTRGLVFGDTVRPEGDEEIAAAGDFSPADSFLRVALADGVTATPHLLLLPIDSPGTEINVVPVCTSNISMFVLS